MKLAIISRSGPCFPNVISQGLAGMLNELNIENEIIYDGIPLLMRLLPLKKKPERWHNNLQFRIRNKITNYSKDKLLLKKLNNYDAIVISECYPNAFWRNYLAIGELRNAYKGRIISYTESPLDAAPLNKLRLLNDDDYNEDIYDFNLFVTDLMEIRYKLKSNQAVAGVNIASSTDLFPEKKAEFTAVIDFAQPGYEIYRRQQIDVLKKIDISTIVLEGRYSIEEIRTIYRKASVFFLAFPETFGLPIAECLACGACVFTPDSSWPMSWRLNECPMPMGQGSLPDCFQVYQDEKDLEDKLLKLKKSYDPVHTPQEMFNIFVKNYRKFLYGSKEDLQFILDQLK